jgi:hypothetical protein
MKGFLGLSNIKSIKSSLSVAAPTTAHITTSKLQQATSTKNKEQHFPNAFGPKTFAQSSLSFLQFGMKFKLIAYSESNPLFVFVSGWVFIARSFLFFFFCKK